MRPALFPLLLLSLIGGAPPASAADEVLHVGETWFVMHADDFPLPTLCTMSATPPGTEGFIAILTEGGGKFSLQASDPQWKVTDRATQVRISIDGEEMTLAARLHSSSVFVPMLPDGFLDRLASASSIAVGNAQGSTLSTVPLSGTEVAMEHLRQCAERLLPADPF